MTKPRILPDISQATADRLAALETENAKLRATILSTPTHRFSMKVSNKGALSVYGLGRWPTTLYRGQWERLLSHRDEILSFVAANAATLKTRED